MLTNDGQKPNTVRHTKYKLFELAGHLDLFNPEAVKHYVSAALSEKTKQPFPQQKKQVPSCSRQILRKSGNSMEEAIH